MDAFGFIPGYRHQVVVSGKEPLVLCLIAFLVTFVLTRLYTRLARKRGWGSGSVGGGIHLHHMVVGIIFILGTGFVTVAFWPGSPGRELIGILFGVGAALTLDEFALWLYLRDVYWSPEGRSSIDATVIGVVFGALLLVGSSPFGVGSGGGEPQAIAFGMVGMNVVLAMITFFKGKLTLGLLSVFVPLLGFVGALRLAAPTTTSAWRFYSRNEAKLTRAQRRYGEDATLRRLRTRFEDVVGGVPSLSMAMGLRMEVVGGRLAVRMEPAADESVGDEP